MSSYAGPEIISNNLVLSIDMANLKSYSGSGTIVTNMADNTTNSTFNLVDSSYYTIANGAVQFTRTTSPTAKDGGGLVSYNMTGNLTSQNFLYRDHTWEIWFRIDDRTPGNYDANEGFSGLANYRGYHAGYHYTSSNMIYYIWDGIVSRSCASWSVGASGAQINEGFWYQAVVTRSGNLFTPYLNGINFGTGSTTVTNFQSNVTSNDLGIGKVFDPAAGTSSYVYYSKSTFSNMKMYNRALSASEINNNFNALRGRYRI